YNLHRHRSKHCDPLPMAGRLLCSWGLMLTSAAVPFFVASPALFVCASFVRSVCRAVGSVPRTPRPRGRGRCVISPGIAQVAKSRFPLPRDVEGGTKTQEAAGDVMVIAGNFAGKVQGPCLSIRTVIEADYVLIVHELQMKASANRRRGFGVVGQDSFLV